MKKSVSIFALLTIFTSAACTRNKGAHLAQSNSPTALPGYEYLDLDFEMSTTSETFWNADTSTGTCLGTATATFDQGTAASGSQSAHLQIAVPDDCAADQARSIFYTQIPAAFFIGKHIRLTASYRTKAAIDPANIALVLSQLLPDQQDGDTIISPTDSSEPNTWEQLSKELTISPQTQGIYLSVAIMNKPADVWFDDIKIELLDDDLVLKGPVDANAGISSDQLAAIEHQAISVPADFTIPEAVFHTISDAAVVALGEATHGTKEFFLIKNEIIKTLVTQHGYRIFAIEASMTPCAELNDYVIHGRGDPKALLAKLGFVTWNTQEVLDLILWLRTYNESHANDPVQFWGFDLQNPSSSKSEVLKILQSSASNDLTTVTAHYLKVDDGMQNQNDVTKVQIWSEAAEKVVELLTTHAADYIARIGSEKFSWLVQNARLVRQDAQNHLPNGESRDESMASNVLWLKDRFSSTKIILWAHDGHIKKLSDSSIWMGNILRDNLGAEYRALGFTFHSGSFNVIDRTTFNFKPIAARPAHRWSYGGIFHKLQQPVVYFDSQAVNSDPNVAILHTLPNSEGDVFIQQSYQITNLFSEFDGIFHVDVMTPSASLNP